MPEKQKYLNDIFNLPSPNMPIPTGQVPETQPEQEKSLSDIFQIDPQTTREAPTDISGLLKNLLARGSNAAIGAKLTPGGMVSKTIGGLFGLANDQPMYDPSTNTVNLTNLGLATSAGLNKFRPGMSEAAKQALSAAVPAAANVAQSEDKGSALASGITGVALQGGLGAMSDVGKLQKRGYRSAAKDINDVIDEYKTIQLKPQDEMAEAFERNAKNQASKKEYALRKQDALFFGDKTPRRPPNAQKPISQHPEVVADIAKLKAKSPQAFHKNIEENPIKELSNDALDSYFKGNFIQNDAQKQRALAKLRSYRELAPDSTEPAKAYTARVLKDLNLAKIITGTEDLSELKQTLAKSKLDDEALEIIFGDKEVGKAFRKTVEKLPEALSRASAEISLDKINSTAGATGFRIGMLGALIDPNAWVNWLGSPNKKTFLKQNEQALRTLDLMSDPAKIKKLEVTLGRRGIYFDLLRSLVLTATDKTTAGDAKLTPAISVSPQAEKQAQELQRTQP